MNQQTIGKTICEHRKKNGLTQKALATMLNVTDKAVSKWERDIARPDINTIPKLAEILGIPVELLLNIPIRPQAEPQPPQTSAPENSQIVPAAPVTQDIPYAVLDTQAIPFYTSEYSLEELDDLDYLEECEREPYKEASKSLLRMGLLGSLIGILLGLILVPFKDQPFLTPIILLWALGLSGLIYGWTLFGKLLDGWFIVGSLPVIIIAFAFRLAGSILIGWIAYPISLLYNLAKAQRKKSFGRGFLFSLLGLFIAVLSALAIFIVVQTVSEDDSDDNFQDYVSAAPSPYVADPSLFYSSAFDLQTIYNDSLEATLADMEPSSGVEILTQPSLNAAYFLNTDSSNIPHTEYGKNISLYNALMVITSYKDRIINSDERVNVTIWVYPNFTTYSDGSVSYEKMEEYTYYMNCDDLTEVYEWLTSEFDDMTITELHISN